jgi:hypothetical protein
VKLNSIIYRILLALLKLNARVYGTGASRELCRDLAGTLGGGR